jgi:DNA-binding transcriptional MocR family regulator
MGLKLNMQRGQPSDANFDLANPLLSIVDGSDTVTPSGVEIRNYPGGVLGLAEARALFADLLGARPEETVVGNSSSLKIISNLLLWAMVKGLKDSDGPWAGKGVKFVVTTPGYDRHFYLLETLGIGMIPVPMTGAGPDMELVEKAVAGDPLVKGILFVPTYSNPTGEIISAENVKRLASMKTAAKDFTILADEAYAIHHLNDTPPRTPNLLEACKTAGNPDRVFVFGSTSKITFSGAGVGYMASSEANVQWYGKLLGAQTITPNKIEQYRHVKFLTSYPGGVCGLMRDHARILGPKFEAVSRVLERELGGTGLASWSSPSGGYFISFDTAYPVADRVVKLAGEAGVSLTPAGATFPYGKDPGNRNIRIAPTRPPVKEVEQAMEVLALCVKLASAEYLSAGA